MGAPHNGYAGPIETVLRGHATSVGIRLLDGAHGYNIVKLVVAVSAHQLDPDALDRTEQLTKSKVLVVEGIKPGRREVLLAFDGKGSDGTELPVGAYVASFLMSALVDDQGLCPPVGQSQLVFGGALESIRLTK